MEKWIWDFSQSEEEHMGTTPTVQDNTVCITVSPLWLDEPTEALKGYVGLTVVGWCDNLSETYK